MTSEPEKIDPQGIALLAGLGDLRKGLTGAYAQVVCQSELRKHVLAYLEDNQISTTIVDRGRDQLNQDQREWLSEASYDGVATTADPRPAAVKKPCSAATTCAPSPTAAATRLATTLICS